MSEQDFMSCGHRLRFWSPLEGTIACALAFRQNPEQHGFCEICRAVRNEREACARITETYDDGGYDPDGKHEIAAAIRARGQKT